MDSARAEECEYIRTYRQLAIASSCLGRASPILAAAISFAAIGYTEDSVDPANYYAALSVCLALRMPMILLPMSVTMLFSFFVSLQRIKAYLLLPERKAQRYEPQNYPNAAIVVWDATFHFLSSNLPQDKSKDEHSSFTLSVNKLRTGVYDGNRGSCWKRKTALLSEILGDMKGSEGVCAPESDRDHRHSAR